MNHRGYRILIVEDHDPTRAALGALLRNAGHQVTSACGCQQARQLGNGEQFDLLITDVSLPDGDGRALLSELSIVRAVTISGHDMPADPVSSAALPAAATCRRIHLVKPTSFDQIMRAIEQVMAPAL
jgi:CheY-like chemotaxis protein